MQIYRGFLELELESEWWGGGWTGMRGFPKASPLSSALIIFTLPVGKNSTLEARVIAQLKGLQPLLACTQPVFDSQYPIRNPEPARSDL